MAIDRIPGVGPTNTDVANAVAAAVPTNSSIANAVAAAVPTNSSIANAVAAAVPTNSSIANAVAAAVPTNSSITNIVQTYASGKTFTVQEFNSSGNWTAPTGVNAVQIFLVGGGGGAGGSGTSNANTLGAGAGGGGQVVITTKAVTPGTNYAVTIGGGGAGGTATGANSGGNGSVGGTSSFGNLVSALGGGYGWGYQTNNVTFSNGWTGGGGCVRGQGGTGAGGGAGGDAQRPYAIGSTTTYSATIPYNTATFEIPASSNGGGGKGSGSATTVAGNASHPAIGGQGILGYGGGGGGGLRTQGATLDWLFRGPTGRDGGGNGAWADTVNTIVAGNAGEANKGGGGGGLGGSANLNTNPSTGYAGGSGYCRIEYFA